MHYKKAYLQLFNQLTDVITLLENLDDTTEQVDVALLLKQLQAQAEDVCVG